MLDMKIFYKKLTDSDLHQVMATAHDRLDSTKWMPPAGQVHKEDILGVL